MGDADLRMDFFISLFATMERDSWWWTMNHHKCFSYSSFLPSSSLMSYKNILLRSESLFLGYEHVTDENSVLVLGPTRP